MEENAREKGSKTCFRTATKSFMRRNKAADRWLERKIWPLYLAVRKKLTAERESETKGGKQAQCPKQQLLWNKRHIRAKYPRTQKPELVTSHFTSTTSPMACKEYSYSLKGGVLYLNRTKKKKMRFFLWADAFRGRGSQTAWLDRFTTGGDVEVFMSLLSMSGSITLTGVWL